MEGCCDSSLRDESGLTSAMPSSCERTSIISDCPARLQSPRARASKKNWPSAREVRTSGHSRTLRMRPRRRIATRATARRLSALRRRFAAGPERLDPRKYGEYRPFAAPLALRSATVTAWSGAWNSYPASRSGPGTRLALAARQHRVRSPSRGATTSRCTWRSLMGQWNSRGFGLPSAGVVEASVPTRSSHPCECGCTGPVP